MITITRSLVKQLRAVFRRAGIGYRPRFGAGVPIKFLAGADGLRIQARSHEVAIEYHQPGEYTAETLTVPFEFLAECEGARDDSVTLALQRDNHIEVCWSDHGLPQAKRFADCSGDISGVSPSPPESWTPADQSLLDALREAMETTAKEDSRRGLDCVQLRGATGQIMATDASQLLIQDGFQFPWPGDVLISNSRLFGSPELARHAPIELGKTDQHLVFRIGAWTLSLVIRTDVRFPNVEHVIPAVENTATRFRIAADDGQVLADVLDRLPASDEDGSPITVDCNGHVAIRAKAADHPQVTELVLSRAELAGQPIRFNTDRRFLQRAIALGFREVHITDSTTPLLCHDARRKYVWQAMTPEGALLPSDDCVRIELPVSQPSTQNHKSPRPHTHTNRINRMSHNNHTRTNRVAQATATATPTELAASNANGHDTGHESEPVSVATNPESELLALRESLRSALTHTSRLVAALRQQRKQHRLVQSTLASLKQLQSAAS